MTRWFFIVSLALSAAVILPAGAQDAGQQQCAAVLNAAVASTVTECADLTGLGVCLGSLPASLELSQEIVDASFENPGDRVGLALVDELQLGAFNEMDGAWGVVTGQVRLALTDGQVYLLAHGDVTIENLGDVESNVPTASLTVVSAQGLNVRERPETTAPLVDVVFTGDSIRATGRLDDNSWIRVQTANGEHGWAVASVFDGTDFDRLLPVAADNLPDFGSMQAFSLTTGVSGNTTCDNVPPNGVLLQTPDIENGEIAHFMVNDTPVNLLPGSTVFLQATENEDAVLQVDVLEGQVDMTDRSSVLVEAGQGVIVREGEVPIPAPYDYASLSRILVERLPRPIFVALDFTSIVEPAQQGVDPLEGLGMDDDCTIAAALAAANLREEPAPNGRVRYVMQIGESARPDGRGAGADNTLWWRLAPDVWVSSNAVAALGDCGTLPMLRTN